MSGLANLRGKSAEQLLHDAADLARNNPGLFIAGSIALGLAFPRFSRPAPRLRRQSAMVAIRRQVVQCLHQVVLALNDLTKPPFRHVPITTRVWQPASRRPRRTDRIIRQISRRIRLPVPRPLKERCDEQR